MLATAIQRHFQSPARTVANPNNPSDGEISETVNVTACGRAVATTAKANVFVVVELGCGCGPC